MSERRDGLIVTIGVFKLVKTVLLVALAVGALSMLHRDVRAVLDQWVQPSHHLLRRAVARLDGVDEKQLLWVGIGSFVYAALFAVEGIGLVLRRTWAEYLTIAITTSFVPLEIYELVAHKSAMKVFVIAVNIAIVVYLVLRLRADEHWPFTRRTSARPALQGRG